MNQPQDFLNAPAHGSSHPAPTPIQQVQEGRVGDPKAARTYADSQKAVRIYRGQLLRYGIAEFALLAYGPFSTVLQRQQAETRVLERMPELIQAATAPEVARILEHLEAGRLFHVVGYLVHDVWPRVLRQNPDTTAIPALKEPNQVPYVPAPRPVRVAEEERVYQTPVPSGPANLAPLITVAYPNSCTLTKPVLLALNLRPGCRVHLVAPNPNERGGKWYLDLNPKPGVGTRLPVQGRMRFRTTPLLRKFFQKRTGAKPGAPATESENRVCPSLHFRLGEQVPGHAGYYELVPY